MNSSVREVMPHARTEELVVRELPEEMLVYDLKRNKAHCLNRVAALVWRHCDGQTTAEGLTALLAQELESPVTEDVIWYALDQLSKAHLMKERVPNPARMTGLSRRAAMRKLSLAAAVTLPLVTSIIAPLAVNAQTTISSTACNVRAPNNCGGTPCTGGGRCLPNPGNGNCGCRG